MIPQTMTKATESYYSYEDIEEVDEINSESDDSLDEISEYSLYSSDCSTTRQEWLSTIAEETSFDLRTRQTMDSFSLASEFDDDLDDDDYEDDSVAGDGREEEIEYLRGVERQIEVLRQRLKRFSNENGSVDDDLSINTDEGDDYYSDSDNNPMEPLEPPSMERQRSETSAQSLKSTDKDYLRSLSQSTGTTWENSSTSSSTSTSDDDDTSSPGGDGVVDFVLDMAESERQEEDPSSVASSTMKDSSYHAPANPLNENNKSKNSEHLRWIGTNIQFSLAASNQSGAAASDLSDSVSNLDVESIVSELVRTGTQDSRIALDFGLQTPTPSTFRSPKPKKGNGVLPTTFSLPQLDEDSPTSKSSSSEYTTTPPESPTSFGDTSSSLPIIIQPCPRSPKNIDAMVASKKTLLRMSMTTTAATKTTTTTSPKSSSNNKRFQVPPPRPRFVSIPPPFAAEEEEEEKEDGTTRMMAHQELEQQQHVQSAAYLRRDKKRQGIKARLQGLQDRLALFQQQQEEYCQVVMQC